MTNETTPIGAAEDTAHPERKQHDAPVIRESQLVDHTSIAWLMHQLGYATTPALMLEKLQSLCASPADKILVAVKHGEVVGSISLHVIPLFHAAGCLGRITSMVVDGRWRRAGVGGALLDAAERWFKSVGCVKLEVTSGDHRPDAHRIYARHGFLRDGQRLAKTIDL